MGALLLVEMEENQSPVHLLVNLSRRISVILECKMQRPKAVIDGEKTSSVSAEVKREVHFLCGERRATCLNLIETTLLRV